MRGRKKVITAKRKMISIRVDDENYEIYKNLDKSLKQDLGNYVNNYLKVFKIV